MSFGRNLLRLSVFAAIAAQPATGNNSMSREENADYVVSRHLIGAALVLGGVSVYALLDLCFRYCDPQGYKKVQEASLKRDYEERYGQLGTYLFYDHMKKEREKPEQETLASRNAGPSTLPR